MVNTKYCDLLDRTKFIIWQHPIMSGDIGIKLIE